MAPNVLILDSSALDYLANQAAAYTIYRRPGYRFHESMAACFYRRRTYLFSS